MHKDEEELNLDLSKLRDRGSMKWSMAMMLPEHVEMLQEFLNVEYHEVKKPIIDEFQLQEFDQKAHYAMEFAHFVIITTWQNGFFETVVGQIHYLDPIKKELRLKDEEGFIERIKFADITGIKVLDD